MKAFSVKNVNSNKTFTHQFLSILRVVINERLSIEKEEDPIGRNLGLGVVGGKGGCLTDGQRTKDDHDRNSKDIDEGLMKNVSGGKESEEGTETKDNRKEDKDTDWSDPISETVHLRVHNHSVPTREYRE